MKLPDISRSWAVPELKSPKSAGLGNKLRGIEATTLGVQKVASTLGSAVEKRADTEAKISATRVGNTISREFVAKDTELRQSYFNREDFDPEVYKQEREALREKVIRDNTNNLGSRQQRHLEPTLSKYRGGDFEAQTQKTMLDLTSARAQYELERLSDDNLNSVYQDPDLADSVVASFDEAVDAGDVGSLDNRRVLKREHARAVSEAQIYSLMRGNRVGDGYEILENDPAKFSAKTKDELRSGLEKAGYTNIERIISEEGFRLGNNPDLYNGQDSLNNVLSNLPNDDSVTVNATAVYESGRFSQYVSGLVSQKEFDKAEAELTNQSNAPLMDGATRAKYMASVESNRATHWGGQAAGVLKDATDYTNKLLGDGVPNPAIGDSMRALALNASTPGEKARIDEALNYLELVEDFSGDFVAGIDNMSIDDMTDMRTQAMTWAENPTDHTARQKIVAAWSNNIEKRQDALMTDGAGYLAEYDPEVRAAEEKATSALSLILNDDIDPDADKTGMMAEARQAWGSYSVMVSTGLNERGVPELAQTFLPKESTIGSLISEGLASSSTEAQQQALTRLNHIVADDDVSNNILAQVSDSDPAYAAALSYIGSGDTALASMTLNGRAIEASMSDNEEQNQIAMGYLRGKVDDLTAGVFLGSNELEKVRDGLVYGVLGGLSKNQINQVKKKGSGGREPNLPDEFFNAVLDMTVGQGFAPNDNSDAQTLSYTRTDSGRLVQPAEWKAQMKYTAQNMLETQGTLLYNSAGAELDASDVFAKAEFRPVGNGKYEVTLPHSSLVSSSSGGSYMTVGGLVNNAAEEPFILDMNKSPMPSQVAATVQLSALYTDDFSRGDRGMKDEFLEDTLRKDEGFKAESYVDSEGHLTAGYGHKMSSAERARYPEGETVPKAVTDKWFKQDVSKARAGATTLFKEFGIEKVPTEVRQAISNMVFQLGTDGVRKFPAMWKNMQEGNWAGVVAEMRDSKWHNKQTPNRAARVIGPVAAMAGVA